MKPDDSPAREERKLRRERRRERLRELGFEEVEAPRSEVGDSRSLVTWCFGRSLHAETTQPPDPGGFPEAGVGRQLGSPAENRGQEEE